MCSFVVLISGRKGAVNTLKVCSMFRGLGLDMPTAL